MGYNTLNGTELYKLLKNGYRNLKRNEKTIDNLNVFPVPDGDTGKNMSTTFLGGVENAQESVESAGLMLKAFSRGCLLSARGNSGVILSQIIRGMSDASKGKDILTVSDLFEAFKGGVKRSYSAVSEPVEGTILTVIREGCEFTEKKPSCEDFSSFLQTFIDSMKESLAHTPDLLPVLREAGVVDSGGAGLICIFEGMLMGLNGEVIIDDTVSDEIPAFCISGNGSSSRPHSHYGIVAIAQGDGIKDFFLSSGTDVIIDGGKTCNPSAKAFLEAFDSLDADEIIVFPNDSNIIMTAKQAGDMYKAKDKKITVVETTSVAECYSALSMLDLNLPTSEDVVAGIAPYFQNVTTGYISAATRDAFLDGIEIKAGDYIGFTKDAIYVDEPNRLDCFREFLQNIPDIENKEVITVFYGKDVDEKEMTEIENFVRSREPLMEIGFIYGGQEVYDYILSIE